MEERKFHGEAAGSPSGVDPLLLPFLDDPQISQQTLQIIVLAGNSNCSSSFLTHLPATWKATILGPGQNLTRFDAAGLKQFRDAEFDLLFSFYSLECCGDWEAQFQASIQMRRISKKYALRTSHFYSCRNPNSFLPGIHFLPPFLQRLFPPAAGSGVRFCRLLTRRELDRLFPLATIGEQKNLPQGSTLTVVSDYSL